MFPMQLTSFWSSILLQSLSGLVEDEKLESWIWDCQQEGYIELQKLQFDIKLIMRNNQRLKNSIYQRNLLEKVLDSKISFQSIDTPGWTSMVQTSKEVTEHSNIKSRNSFQPLATGSPQFDGKDISNRLYIKSKHKKGGQYCSIKKEEDQNQHPLSMFEKIDEGLVEQKPKKKLKELIERRLKGYLTNSQASDSILPSQFSVTSSNNSQQIHSQSSKMISKDQSISRQNSSSRFSKKNSVDMKKSSVQKKESRFKEISVHEHLYQTSKKLEKKKEMIKILDNKYHSEMVAPFQPTISRKSSQMAVKKFSMTESQIATEAEQKLSVIKQKIDKTKVVEKKYDENQKKLFTFLSENGAEISEQSLSKSVEELPLPCVRLLDKIVKHVFTGTNYNQQQFYDILGNKKIVANRQKLIKCFIRWKETQKINDRE